MADPTLPPQEPPADLPQDTRQSYIPQRPSGHDTIESVSPMELAQSVVLSRWSVGTSTLGRGSSDGISTAGTGSPEYTLHRVVGRGGFGEVWEAWQASLGRVVAVKRPREDTPAASGKEDDLNDRIVAFRQEAVTSAQLDHPNIVPVYDLGLDADGRPLLAMKLVKGKRWEDLIVEDFSVLSVSEFLARHLEILIGMSQAVAFAHSRGIVHRDLKTTQVMVGEFGEVLLMDWGLALFYDLDLAQKASGCDPESLRNALTPHSGTNPSGTVAFMAPEQTQRTCKNIGPHTDVYLLGGSLYFLLTGRLPHGSDDARTTFLRAMRGEVFPPHEVAPRREIPRELADLAMRAMARKPEDRVPSAKAFIQELRDYLGGAYKRRESLALTDEVKTRVDAAKGSYREFSELAGLLAKARGLWPENPHVGPLREGVQTGYAHAALANNDLVLARVQAELLDAGTVRDQLLVDVSGAFARVAKREQQRKLAFAGLGVLAIAVGVSMFFVVLARQSAGQQRETALLLERINKLRRDENVLAEDLARALPLPNNLDVVNDETTSSTATTEPLLARRRSLHADRDALRADPRVGDRLDAEPLQLQLADANLALVKARTRDESLAAYRQFERMAKRLPEAAEPLMGMGISAGRADEVTSAAVHLQAAAELLRKRDGDRSPQVARALALAGQAIRRASEPGRGAVLIAKAGDYRTYYEQAIDILERQWVETGLSLSEQWVELGDNNHALEFTSSTLAVATRRFGPESLEAARIHSQEGIVVLNLGHYDEAEREMDTALRIRQKLLGPEAPQTAQVLANISSVYSRQGEMAKSTEYEQRAYEIFSKVLGPNHHTTIFSLSNLCISVSNEGRWAEAEPLARKVLDAQRIRFGSDHPMTARANSSLGYILTNLGKPEEGERYGMQAYLTAMSAFGKRHPVTATYATEMGFHLNQQGKFEEAAKYYGEALETRRQLFGNRNDTTLESINNLAFNMQSMGRTSEAEKLFKEAYEGLRELLGDKHPSTLAASLNYGLMVSGSGRFKEAEPIIRAAADNALEVLGEHNPDAFTVIEGLGTNLGQQDRYREAEQVYRRVLDLRLKDVGEGIPLTGRNFGMVAEMADMDGRFPEAESDFKKSLSILERVAPPGHPFLLNTRDSYAWGLSKAGRLEEAEVFARRNLKDALASQPAEHPAVIRASTSLLHILAARGTDTELAAILARRVDNAIATKKDVRSLDLAWTRQRDFVSVMESECKLLMARSEPHDAAADVVLRGVVYATLAGLSGDNVLRTRFLNPRIAELGLEATAKELEEKVGAARASLWPDRTIPMSGPKLSEFIDKLVPPTNWAKEFPAIKDWDLSGKLK